MTFQGQAPLAHQNAMSLLTAGRVCAIVLHRLASADTSPNVEHRVQSIALLQYIPRAGSLASFRRLCASWYGLRVLARSVL
jgi:hypothetical protein